MGGIFRTTPTPFLGSVGWEKGLFYTILSILWLGIDFYPFLPIYPVAGAQAPTREGKSAPRPASPHIHRLYYDYY